MIPRGYPSNITRRMGGGDRGGAPGTGWIDLVVVLGILALLWLVVVLGGDMRARFDELHQPALSLDPALIPYYTGRTVLRMFIAYGCSLLFTFAYGYVAAKSRAARLVLLPALDILQSVPVFGFLAITVTGFLALFPGSLLGVECASIFVTFTAQAWNMTFGFYHSLVTIPPELKEASRVYRLNRWQRFTNLELPAGAIGLIWNSMMSFGGGWFFVAQSEAISVLNKDIKLPGLGSYMASAARAGDTRAALWAIGAMVVTIVLVDQLLWRPLVAWAEKFKLEQTESADTPGSWVLDLLRGSAILRWLSERVFEPLDRSWQRVARLSGEPGGDNEPAPAGWSVPTVLAYAGVALIFAFALYELSLFAREVIRQMPAGEMLRVVWLGVLTLLRVAAMTILATLIWTPLGVWIGSKPRVARVAQPLAQIAASFPVNMTFPFLVGFFIAAHVPIDWGSVLLIALGTQWYILFNVIAGAMAIPTDLREAAGIFGLRGWRRWKTLVIPAIFPFWVTGAVTAAGGAWNASIVAEVASWGNDKLVAHGLGAYIAEVTEKGDKLAIYFSILVMSGFVVTINQLLWRPLYGLAERRYKLS